MQYTTVQYSTAHYCAVNEGGMKEVIDACIGRWGTEGRKKAIEREREERVRPNIVRSLSILISLFLSLFSSFSLFLFLRVSLYIYTPFFNISLLSLTHSLTYHFFHPSLRQSAAYLIVVVRVLRCYQTHGSSGSIRTGCTARSVNIQLKGKEDIRRENRRGREEGYIHT